MGNGATREELDAGRGYEALHVPALFGPWTQHVLDGAQVRPGADVLDVACGTGVLARHALEHVAGSGRVVGVDPAPGMIAVAAEIEPRIEWVQGRAEALDFADGTFDCVVSQFGMMFFEDRQAAGDEIRRVLRPGGRVAIAVWNGLGENPVYRDLAAVLDDLVGTAAGDALRLPFCLGDDSIVTDVLAKAGLEGVSVSTRTAEARFPTSRTLVEAELRGWLPLFGIVLDEDRIAEVLARSEARIAGYATGSGETVFPTSAHVIAAQNPTR